jgi:hypothetical protein
MSDSRTPKIAIPARSLKSMNTAVPLGFPKGTGHGAVEGEATVATRRVSDTLDGVFTRAKEPHS